MAKRYLAVLSVGLASACGGITDATAPRILDVSVRETGPLVRHLDVTLEEPAAVLVEYWADDGPRLRVRSDAASTHSVALTRLRAGRDYEFVIEGTGSTGTFGTGPLPDDLAEIRFVATGAPTTPLTLLHASQPDGYRGYVVVDAEGEVVWYERTEGFPYGMTRRDNGNFVYMDAVRGLREIAPTGELVAELAQDTIDREMHHDVIATPDQSLLFIAFDTREFDGASLKGEAIWEWWPESGVTERRWTSWDHLSPAEDRGPRFGTEWMHANSLSLGPRGNVLLSVHYFNQVISIAPDWQALEWRLGGVNATITVDEAEQFSGQHTAAEVVPGRVLLLDNGRDRGGYSRAVEFEIVDGHAHPAWEWRATPDNFAFAVSSARRLSNGNTLIGFGMAEGLLGSVGGTEAYEVMPDGVPIWHLRVEAPRVMYRAEPLQSIGDEEG